jgi:hypothetical protein
MAYAAASKPTQPTEGPVTASAKPAEAVSSQQTTPQPRRTLFDTFAIALAKGDLRQKHAKALTPAETDAKACHEKVRGQILEAFRGFCNGTREHLAGVPLKERFYVFHDERRDLQKELGKILREAGEDYTHMAMAYRSELGTDPLSWVEGHLKTDRAGITRTTELQMGQRAERKVEHDPAVVNDPLELRGRRAAVVCHELSKSTSKKSTLQKLSSPPFEDANKNMGTARQCESSTSCVSFWDERELLVK